MSLFATIASKRVTNFALAIMLVLSTFAASVPFIFSDKTDALSGATYSNVDLTTGWVTDRTAPSGGSQNVVFDGRNALELLVDAPTNAPSSFYQFEGLKKTISPSNTIKADLYIDPTWPTNVRTGIWGEGYDSSNAISSYPVIEYNTASLNHWRIFDSVWPGAWRDITVASATTGWNTIELAINRTDSTKTDIYVNDVYVGASIGDPTESLKTIFLNNYNFGTDDYVVRWSNIETGTYAPNTPPAVVFNTPTPVDNTPVHDTLTGNVTATDDYGMGSYYVRFWKDAYEIAGGGTLLDDCSSASGAFLLGTSETVSCSFDTTTLAENTKIILSAQFLDGDGVWGSDMRTYTVDNIHPTITVKPESSGSGTTFSNVSFKLYDAQKIDKITINGVPKELTNNTYSDINGVKPGTLGAVEGLNALVVYDVAGNTTEYTFTIDTTAPGQPTLVTPDWYIANGATKTLDWNVPTSNNSDIVYYEYAEYNNTAPTSDTTTPSWVKIVNAPTTATTDTAWGSDVKIFWRVRAVDTAGNRGPWSVTRTIITDRADPTVSIDSYSFVAGNLSAQVSGTDNLSGIRRIGFNLYNASNTTLVKSLKTLDFTGHNLNETSTLTSFDISDVPSGTYVIRAAALDFANNLSDYDLQTITVDNIAPTVTIDQPAITLINDATPTITGTYDDVDTNHDTTILLSIDGATGVVVTKNPDGTWTYTLPTALREGTRTFVATASDDAGNPSDTDGTLSLTIDTANPSLTVNSGTVSGDVATITGTAEVGAILSATFNGVTTAIVNVNGTWSFTSGALENGTYAFSITATDGAGNGTIATTSVLVDVPVITITPAIVSPVTTGVLGATTDTTTDETTTNNEGESDVEGATDTLAAVDTDATDGSIFGLAWYWWLLILAAIAAITSWVVATVRRRNNSEA